jgi:hypothetical protein
MKAKLGFLIFSFFLFNVLFAQDEVDSSIFVFPADYDSISICWGDTFKMQSNYLNNYDLSPEIVVVSKKVNPNTSDLFIYFIIIWFICVAVFFYYADYLSFILSTIFNISLINQLIREKNILIPAFISALVLTTLFSFYFSLNILGIDTVLLFKLTGLLLAFILLKFSISNLVIKISDYHKEMNIALLYYFILLGFISIVSSLLLSAYYFGYFFTDEMYFTTLFSFLGTSVLLYLFILFRSYQFINTQFTVSFFLYLCTFEIMPIAILTKLLVSNIG